MKLHKRTMPVQKAYTEAQLWLLEWANRHELTPAEEVGFLAGCLQSISKYAIRQERGVERGDEAE